MLLPDFSILESSIWMRLEAKACQGSYQKLEPLTSVIRDRWNKMDDDVTQRAFGAFRSRLHMVIGAECNLRPPSTGCASAHSALNLTLAAMGTRSLGAQRDVNEMSAR